MTFASPQRIVSKLNIQPGMTVVDFGAGKGDYAIAAAQMVGNGGRVYAIDIQKKLVEHIKAKAKEAGYENVDVIWGDLEEPEGSRLDGGIANRILAVNVLFQLSDTSAFLNELSRVLKDNGEVYVIDWSGSFGGIGPPEKLVLSREEAENIFRENGFEIVRDIPAGSHHWGFVAKFKQ